MTIQELFIANLKAYRKLRGISQMQLAALCDSSTGYIGEIETGRCFPSVNMIEKIAASLEIDSWQLFRNEPINLSNSNAPAKLAHTQRTEIIKMTSTALSKILEKY